jgi:hypothetical protein
VKAVVDYAGAMSNKTGDSASDFNAANLSVVTLTINQGVTLSAPKGKAEKLAILEGNLSISGNMKIVGTCEISASTDIVGDLRVFKSLQIGNGKDTQAVNRIVNRINESGNPDPANDTALPTVKAAVEYADTKAKKNGNSNEDFKAANLNVKKLTINQKEITAIVEEIKEEEEKGNENAIPTIAAVKTYVENSRRKEVKKEYKWNEEERCGELTVTLEESGNEIMVPITMKRSDKMKIIPVGIQVNRIIIQELSEEKPIQIEYKKDWIECLEPPIDIPQAKDQLWSGPSGIKVKVESKLMGDMYKTIVRTWKMGKPKKALEMEMIEKIVKEIEKEVWNAWKESYARMSWKSAWENKEGVKCTEVSEEKGGIMRVMTKGYEVPLVKNGELGRAPYQYGEWDVWINMDLDKYAEREQLMLALGGRDGGRWSAILIMLPNETEGDIKNEEG